MVLGTTNHVTKYEEILSQSIFYYKTIYLKIMSIIKIFYNFVLYKNGTV